MMMRSRTTRVSHNFRYPLFAFIGGCFLWENLRSNFALLQLVVVDNPVENEPLLLQIIDDSNAETTTEQQQHQHVDTQQHHDSSVTIIPPEIETLLQDRIDQQHSEEHHDDTNEKDPDDHNDDDSSSLHHKPAEKPYLIIHVGPPKTATTTLQEELYANPKMLQQDGYLYTGAFYKDGEHQGDIPEVKSLFDLQCHRKLNAVRIRHDKNATASSVRQKRRSLADKLRRVQCWQESLKALEAYKRQNISLIHSDETMSIMRWRKWHNLSQPAPFDLISLQQALQADWNVVMVVSYRYYWSWLISAKQQVERYKGKPRQRLWPAEGGLDFKAPWPAFLRVELPGSSLRYYPFYYTDSIVNAIRPHLPVKILNLHDQQTVRSYFLCSVLPNAPNACRQSLKLDTIQTETRANIKKSEDSVFYDVLATAAVRIGLVNATAYKRRRVVIDVMNFHQNVILGQSPRDLPLKCPTSKQLSSLLEMSLDKEKAILPDFYAPSHEAEHRASFWQAVETKTFCWIDADAVLQDNVWRTFFSTYSGIGL